MVKQIPLAGESSHTDANQQFSLIGVQGTLGTSDTGGTAATVAFSGDPATGAMYVNNIGAGGGGASGTFVNISTGTQQTLGTVGTILGIGGTVVVSGASAGTFVNVSTGTQQTLGTIGTVNGIGTITSIGSIGTIAGITTGTYVNIVTGTLNAGTLNTGTISAGTINAGTFSIVTGTVVGKEISAAAKVGNGILIAGTDAGGTIYHPLITSGGAVTVTGASAGTFVNISTGTINTIIAGTQNTLGTVGTVLGLGGVVQMNQATGTVNAGTITALGIGTIIPQAPAFQAGSFVAAGTINYAGSQFTTVGVDIGGTWVGTAFFEGQIGTSAFFGIPAITQAGIVGTQTTGNGDYSMDLTALSNARVRLTYSSGTVTHNSQVQSFDSTVQQIANGSLTNVGSIGNLGMLTAGTITTGSLANIGMLTAGTITTLPVVSLASSGTILNLASGTLAAVTSVTNLAAGTVTAVNNIVTGTLAAVTTVTTVSNLTNGSANILTGTLQSSGTTTGVGVVTSVTNQAYGTTTIDPKPVQVGTYAMTLGTTGAAVWGTLVASVGNGVRVYVTGVDIVVSSGTVDVAITNNVAGSTGTGVFARGQFIAGGGISKNFNPTLQTGTGGTIAYWLGGAGTAALGLQYWVAA